MPGSLNSVSTRVEAADCAVDSLSPFIEPVVSSAMTNSDVPVPLAPCAAVACAETVTAPIPTTFIVIGWTEIDERTFTVPCVALIATFVEGE